MSQASKSNHRKKREKKRRAKARKRQAKQLDLALRTWGGRRPGAGRKLRFPRRRVPHRTRPEMNGRHPVHVTTRVVKGYPNLRGAALFRLIGTCIRAARGRFGMRVIEYSVQDNHIHYIVEIEDRTSLSRAMKGLAVRIAKRLNRHLRRSGQVIESRYHARALKTPREVRHGLAYVLGNRRRHVAQRGRVLSPDWVDPCSSGHAFAGWSKPVECDTSIPVLPAKTWLLRVGWKREGLLERAYIPGDFVLPKPPMSKAAGSGPRALRDGQGR